MDVRGARPGSESGYSVQEALRILRTRGVEIEHSEAEGPACEVILVSSYEMIPASNLPVSLPIHPKATETLDLVQQRIRESRGGDASRRGPGQRQTTSMAEVRCLHVLVTGAGFELEASTSWQIGGIGCPDTADVLSHVLKGRRPVPPESKAIGKSATPGDEDVGKPFPIPQAFRDNAAARALILAATERRLDAYWNELLHLEMASIRQPIDDERISMAKLKFSCKEHKLRESFRELFLGYDWGHLS